ncbi:HNH endonuclease [Methylobacterium indicum]|uniref:HNH endonuclease n=1 Tax=Methylobacterium indicum TaxID=1775910 RepID=UPI0009E64368|nr:HNH endonuclease [Methylobacterium indicum]
MGAAPRDAAAVARLHEFLRYDPETGCLFWRKKPSKRVVVGAPAGFPTATGHLRIEIAGHRYWTHHIAWLFVHGVWPSDIVDHINGRPDDNRIANLRIADSSKNMQNSRIYCTNTSGFKGVSFCKQTGKWRAAITKNTRRVHLGRYPSPELAHAAYVRAAGRMFGEFARVA